MQIEPLERKQGKYTYAPRKYCLILPKPGEEEKFEWIPFNPKSFEHKHYPGCTECSRKYLPDLGCIWCN